MTSASSSSVSSFSPHNNLADLPTSHEIKHESNATVSSSSTASPSYSSHSVTKTKPQQLASIVPTPNAPFIGHHSGTFFNSSQPMSDADRLAGGKRSKHGCLTCKIRKKKCKEDRPTCADCKRLNKNCIWVDYDAMSEDEIRKLKEQVERDESMSKLRKRKSKTSSAPIDKSSTTEIKSHHNTVDTEAENNGPRFFDTRLNPEVITDNAHKRQKTDDRLYQPLPHSQSQHQTLQQQYQHQDQHPGRQRSSHQSQPAHSTSPSEYSRIVSLMKQTDQHHLPTNHFQTNVHDRGISVTKNNLDTNSKNTNTKPTTTSHAPFNSNAPSTSYRFNYSSPPPLCASPRLAPASGSHSPTISSLMNPIIPIDHVHDGLSNAMAGPSLSHESHDRTSTIRQAYPNNQHYPANNGDSIATSSPELQIHTQEQRYLGSRGSNHNSNNREVEPHHNDKLALIGDRHPAVAHQSDLSFDHDFPRFMKYLTDAADRGLIADQDNSNGIDSTQETAIAKQANGSGHSSPINFLSPNFNIPSFLESVCHSPTSNADPASPQSPSATALSQLASNLHSMLVPSPQPSLSMLPQLTESGLYLYNYYVRILSPRISIAPTSHNESNSYQRVFLPLAQRDQGVLYSLLAWSAFHLGGEWLQEGFKYSNMALDHVKQLLTQSQRQISDAGTHRDNLTPGESRQSIINKLATLLILCGAEICRGDVKVWTVYLSWGWKILYNNGGILNFNSNKEEHWLISNFAYHDLLASSASARGTYFPSTTYDHIFKDTQRLSRGNLHPLVGMSKILFRIIGDINTLVYESKKDIDDYYSRRADADDEKPMNTSRHRSSSQDSGVTSSPISAPLDSDFAESNADDDNSEDNASDTTNRAKLGLLLTEVIDKANDLELQIDRATPDPDDLANLNAEELEVQLTLFEAFQLCAKLFLRQAVMKCNPSTLESQKLTNQLTKSIDVLLGSTAQASLVFPIFIAGIHCVTEHDRVLMRQRINKLMELYGPWSFNRILPIFDIVWKKNPHGDSVVDWVTILKDLNWDINFA